MQKIKIKYFTDKIEPLDYIEGKSDWIDMRASEEVTLKAGEFALIPLGVAMELPKGYEAHLVPRSSTFKNWGIIQAAWPRHRPRAPQPGLTSAVSTSNQASQAACWLFDYLTPASPTGTAGRAPLRALRWP